MAHKYGPDDAEGIARILCADVIFNQLAKRNRLTESEIEEYFQLCFAARMETIMSASVFVEPHTSAMRKELAELGKLCLRLRRKLEWFEEETGNAGGFFDLVDNEKCTQEIPGDVHYAMLQLVSPITSSHSTATAFLAHAEVAADWLSTHYERQDGRREWVTPNAADAAITAFTRKLSQLCLKCFGRPLDGLVACSANVIFELESPVDSNRVRHARVNSSRNKK